jgi:glycosyltransferase involved in cell wall biosynthesis
VVLPAHNEDAVIAGVIGRCITTLAELMDDFEIVVVDDGSQDLTGDIADAAAAADPRVRVVHTGTNRGYGDALQEGFAVARKPFVFFMDADGQFDIADIARLIRLVEHGHRVVVGYRARRQDPAIRLLNAWCWNLLVRRMFHLRVRDVDCAFKLYETALLRQLDVQARGAMINTEMLAKLARLGITPAQVAVHHYPREHGQPTGANVRVILRAFLELHKLRSYVLRWQAGTLPVSHDLASTQRSEVVPAYASPVATVGCIGPADTPAECELARIAAPSALATAPVASSPTAR